MHRIMAGRPGRAVACNRSCLRPMTIDSIRSDFALLDDWEDRYRYVIELGRGLPPLPEALRNEANKVRGCASQVWRATAARPAGAAGRPNLAFQGHSDAQHVRWLIP